MDPRRIPEYHLKVSADRSSAGAVAKAVLHTIFFHRTFTPLAPASHDVLDLTLPYVSDPPDIAALIDARTAHLAAPPATLTVRFLEKKRRKAGAARGVGGVGGGVGWFGVARAATDEETAWEMWTVELVAPAGSGNGIGSGGGGGGGSGSGDGAEQQRRAMERDLRAAVRRIIDVVSRDTAHIPPITESGTNPFPYQVVVKQR